MTIIATMIIIRLVRRKNDERERRVLKSTRIVFHRRLQPLQRVTQHSGRRHASLRQYFPNATYYIHHYSIFSSSAAARIIPEVLVRATWAVQIESITKEGEKSTSMLPPLTQSLSCSYDTHWWDVMGAVIGAVIGAVTCLLTPHTATGRDISTECVPQ